MKKLLGIVVLGLLLSVNVHAEASEITIDELFGIKILDKIDKYANKADGLELDHLKDIITFEDEFLNIERNHDFDTYYIRTDKNYKIQNITARKFFVSDFDNFKNDCKNEKSTMVRMLSAFFDVNENKFENYYWLDPRSKALYDDSTIKYKDKNTSLILSSYCGYISAEEKLVSILFVSWITKDYHKNHVDGRWTKIEKIDDNFIKVYLSKES
tara:strand:+ start:260 stop:898 length:639 start_codon:yes stop_codon:yes gene_type:complete